MAHPWEWAETVGNPARAGGCKIEITVPCRSSRASVDRMYISNLIFTCSFAGVWVTGDERCMQH